MVRKNSKQLTKETKAMYKAIGRRNRKFLKLTCAKCKRINNIHINIGNEVLYTAKYIKDYICLLCK